MFGYIFCLLPGTELKGGLLMKLNTCEGLLLSCEELFENDDYVLVRFTEVREGKLCVSYEKGVKDSSGDIVRFIKI